MRAASSTTELRGCRVEAEAGARPNRSALLRWRMRRRLAQANVACANRALREQPVLELRPCEPHARIRAAYAPRSRRRAQWRSCWSSEPVVRVVSACALAFSREPAARGGSDDGARRAARRPLGVLLLLRVAGSDASHWKSVGGPARVERERGRLFEAHLGACRLRPVPVRRAVTRACGCEEAFFELGRDVGIGARAGRARRAQ